MSIIEQKLRALGLSVADPKPPVGNYLGSKTMGEMLFASARVSDLIGEVGSEVTEAEAKEAAKNTVVRILSIVKQDIQDLDQIVSVLKMTGFIRSAATFTNQPNVLDGASDLLIELFGQNGAHARTATGVAQLPFGAAVQLDIIFQLKPKT
jgi:enamine deaminase RidA (YjgF/YER057c/UK114 family)